VKFSFFHLMPYPYLPADFDEKYATPSLTFPNKHFDPKLGNQLYQRYLDELEYADELGFDGIAVNEHHQTAYGLMPSPNIMAAALARRTERAKIMVLGNAIGIRGNPLRVAEEIAMLDHLSNGRVVSGFVRGIGWEYFGHSISPTRSRARFDEAHDLIIKAWTSDEMFQWISPNYEYRYVNIWPRPLQQPHPPVYIPGAGSTETMRFCAARRYTYMSVYAPARVVRRWFDGYRQAAAELGYVPSDEMFQWISPNYEYRYVNIWPRRSSATCPTRRRSPSRSRSTSRIPTSVRTARPGRPSSGCSTRDSRCRPSSTIPPGTCRCRRCAVC